MACGGVTSRGMLGDKDGGDRVCEMWSCKILFCFLVSISFSLREREKGKGDRREGVGATIMRVFSAKNPCTCSILFLVPCVKLLLGHLSDT